MPGDDFAIVIGVDHYPRFRRLSGAVGDAERFISWLLDPRGGDLGERDIARVIIQGDEDLNSKTLTARVTEILEERFFTSPHNPGMLRRRLYFYFSGHGIGVDSQEVALLGPEARSTNLSDSLALNGLRLFLQKQALFQELIFVTDCCRNVESDLNPTLQPIALTAAAAPAANQGMTQVCMIFATRHGSVAFEEDDAARGVLSAALLEGLRTNVAVDGSGKVTTETLKPYLFERVKLLAEYRKKNQQPDLQTFPFPGFSLRSGAFPARPITLHISVKNPGPGQCVIRDSLDLKEVASLPLAAELTVLLEDRGPFRIRRTDVQLATPAMLEVDLTDVSGDSHACTI